MSPVPPPRAVVFDLDDTLFDCLGQCVMAAHREAARAMREAGLRADEEAIVQARLAGRLEAERTQAHGAAPDLDLAVARLFPCADPEAAAAAGRRAFHVRDPGPVTPHPFVRGVLEATRAVARTVLLSTGDPTTQRTKIERLGIGDLFDEVILHDLFGGETKRTLLEAWTRRQGLCPADVLVVGDRPGSEIAAALALGCRALRVRAGEFAAEPTPPGATQAPDVRAVLALLDPGCA